MVEPEQEAAKAGNLCHFFFRVSLPMPIPPSEAGLAGARSGRCPTEPRHPRPERENPLGVRFGASRVRPTVRPASAVTASWPATAAYALPRTGRVAPTRETVLERVQKSKPVLAMARPPVVPRVGDHAGADGVGLDVPKDDQQVVVIRDHRSQEKRTDSDSLPTGSSPRSRPDLMIAPRKPFTGPGPDSAKPPGQLTRGQ
jgi:hypothetical protein